mmetsp:Transcript_19489/g.33466  ORF Transcript_19489/g.33466 Transcript_19489/m.33466 type:complete len:209 (-) Transcript_19489:341-967(-)|eukprot:CAMPEP_0196658360 /NCGR_PEP_ID=MMETSP1086-20130531/29378_1 /TAXON_ID=77921 /ORGANISM="Cyanoptyche  gloeocystis , Strain SAG4.97" /LENGTH=208 /DNA_ID=CAMNT_0041991905 /DNA_START=138 /DNA_END=764 /DNA_ORIENTATION=+
MDEGYSHLFKLLLIGDSGVGKTNLLLRFTEDKFVLDSKTTIGVEYGSRSLNVNDRAIKAQIWDTSGQERFRAITKAYYRGAHGVLIVYDVTKRESFDHVQHWLDEVKQHAPADTSIILVGNKKDRKFAAAVPVAEAQRLAESEGMSFFETSALDGSEVFKAFQSLCGLVLSRKLAGPSFENDGAKGRSYKGCVPNQNQSQSQRCCVIS